MTELGNISVAGWGAIVVIATFLFIVLMVHGIKLTMGDKSILIGKRLENKIELFKKEIEAENLKKAHDERLQKMLFKKSIEADDFLYAQMMKNVKKMDGDIYKIFAPYVHCQFPSLTILDIFEDALFERVYFNNMKEKLTGESQAPYIQSIIDDIKANYSLFSVQLKNLHCGEDYPSWEQIENDVTLLVHKWATKSIGFYIENVNKKIEMYRKNAKRFECKEAAHSAVSYPLKKNRRYLEALNEALTRLKGEAC